MHILRRRHGDLFRHCHRHVRTIYDAVSSLNHPRDRGLDHAVEREKYLKPIFNLKNLIIAEPSKSIPLSIITDSRELLNIPFRPIEFIRKYPSIFQEFYPGSLNIQPHIKLTPELISLNSEEDLVYESVTYKENVALRLLKLLMIGRVCKVPIFVLERLRWELGLMKDYEKYLIPEFPDYFRIVNGDSGRGNGKMLELVCWSDEFAISEMEKCENDGKLDFSVKYPKELETDKKYKKWVDEWQKLPYVSPYKNSMHLVAKSDESDKWTVAVLHELLNLFIGKKVERENLLFLGEWLGLRSRFKLALLQHPGIFYVSGKIGTHTVILKEAYKRGMLTERNPLMDMRFKYVQLMNVMHDDEKNKNDQKKTGIVKEGEEGSLDNGEDGQENDDEADDFDDDDDDDYHDRRKALAHENANRRGKFTRNTAKFERKIGDEHLAKKHSRRVNVRNSEAGISRKFRQKSWENGEDRKEDSNGAYDLSDDNRNRDRGNAARRGRFTRNTDRLGENTHRRRRSGRDTEEDDTSKRHLRRSNVRSSDPRVTIRSRRKPDASGNRSWLRTEKN